MTHASLRRTAALCATALLACGDDAPADTTDVADGGDVAADTTDVTTDAGEGSADAAADAAVPGPTCLDSATGTWLVTRFEFLGTNEDGTVDGFDLDDRVSTARDDGGCNKLDDTSSAGTPGIDNQLSELLPALEATGVSLDVLIDARIQEGTLLFAAQLDGTGESCDGLRFQRAEGDPLFATTGRYLPMQTLDLYDGATESTTTSCAWTEGCGLTAAGDELVLEFLFITQEIRIELTSWQGEFRVRDDGTLEGLIGGSVELDSAMDIVTSLGGCGDGPIRDVLEPILPRFADVFPDENGDCTGISAAVRVEAVPIFLFDD